MSDESVDIEFLLNSDEFKQTCNSLTDSLEGTDAASRQEMQKINSNLGAFRDNIRRVERNIADMEKQYGKATGAQRGKLGAEINARKSALAEDIAVYDGMKTQAEGTADANMRLSLRLGELRGEMSTLQAAGQGGSASYQSVEREASTVNKALSETERQLASLSRGTGVFKGIVDGMSGLAGVAGVARGAMALFGKENERVTQLLAKLQAIQGISVSLNQASALAYKDSAFQIQVVSRAKKAWAASTTFLNTQLGISVGLSKALMTGGVGLLIAGIGMLVYKLMSMGKESDVAGESIRKAMDSAAISYGKSKVTLDTYIATLRDETATLSEKLKAQQYLQDNVPGYFAILDKEGKLVRENTSALEDYNATLMQRAMLESLGEEEQKAMADFGMAARKYEKAKEAVKEREDYNQKNNIKEGDWKNTSSVSSSNFSVSSKTVLGELKESRNDAEKIYLEAQKNIEKLQAEKSGIMDELKKIEDSFNKENGTIGEEIKKLENQKASLDETYKNTNFSGKSDADIQKEQNLVSADKAAIEKRLEFLKLKNQPAAVDTGRDEALRNEQAIGQAILANQFKLEQERLAIVQDGRAKRLDESKLEYEQQKAAINDDQAALAEKYQAKKQPMPDEVKAIFDTRHAENENARTQRDTGIDQAYDTEMEDRAKALTDVLLTEEQKRVDAIRERYNKEYEWAEKNIADPDQKQDYLAKVDAAEEHDITFDLLEKYKTYAQKRLEIEEKYQDDINALREAGAGEESIALAGQEKQDTLDQLDATMAAKDEQFQAMMDRITGMSLDKLEEALAEAETALQGIEADGGKDSKKAGVERTKTRVLKEQIRTLKAKNDTKEVSNADKWKNTLEVMEKTRTTVDTMINSFDGLDDSTKAALSAASNIAGGVILMIGSIQTLSITGAKAVEGVERASVILTIISAALQITMALFNIFNKDKKKEKKIQELQKEVENLSRAYDKLGQTMENTFSSDVYALMDDQQENLRKQQELLRKQIAEEESKKKVDRDKIDDWNNQIEDISGKIAENERKRIETLAGTDVKAAISSFSDALVEAYAAGGEKGSQILADTTKKMMANAVKGALEKKFLGDAVQNAVDYLGTSMEDGILSGSEQASFEQMMDSAGERFTAAMKAYDNLFKGDETEEDLNSARGQVQAQLTEQTGSEFLGLCRVNLDVSRQNKDINAEMLAISRTDTQCLADQLRQQILIQENTRRTADNTDGVRDELKSIKSSLQNIENKGGGLYGK